MVKCLANVVEVGEDECFGLVETYGNDVLCVLPGKFLDCLDSQVWSKEKLFVIRELNDKRDIKDIL